VKESSTVKDDKKDATDLLKNAYPTYSAAKDSQETNAAMKPTRTPTVATITPAAEPRISVGNMNKVTAPVTTPASKPTDVTKSDMQAMVDSMQKKGFIMDSDIQNKLRSA
jgi:hypothetical protein